MYSLGDKELVAFLRVDLPLEIKKRVLDKYEEGIPAFWKPHIKNRVKRYVSQGQMFSQGFIYQGFGGQLFNITFLEDGSGIMSNNLWHIGQVPKSLQEYLPDNIPITECSALDFSYSLLSALQHKSHGGVIVQVE